MIGEAEARSRILEIAHPLPARDEPLEGAPGLRVAHDLRAETALPRFDQSAMDGYAIRAVDANKPLRVIGEQPAGRDRGLRVQPGEAVRIFTGAPISSGATAVLIQEDVDRTGDVIRARCGVADGEFIRRAGEDVAIGQLVQEEGARITPTRMALLLSLGISTVHVHPKPRVRIITTGDELRPANAQLQPGESVNSNGPMLSALLADDAICAPPIHSPDDPTELAGILESADDFDAVVLSGGVSVGDYDPVHTALEIIGAERIFWKVDIKPGKPFLFAHAGRRLYFGLPGNPVSSFVTALIFVLPALRRLGGATPESAAPQFLEVPLAHPVENSGPRPHYLRGEIRSGLFHPAPVQQSHGLRTLANANALLRLAPNTRLEMNSLATVLPIPFAD